MAILDDALPWLVPTLAGLFGLAVGSFLNVCSLRWPEDESVVSPPSRCPECGARVRWRDNVPVLSWIALRGRCRSCRAGISIQYPLVELATGLVWAGIFVQAGLSWEALRGSLFLTLLLGIAVSDARFYIIPDQFTLGGGVLGLALSFAPGPISPRDALLGAAAGYAGLWLIGRLGTWLFRKEAMGGGDVKMMAMVGAFTGVTGTALTVFLGALLGSVVFGPIAWKTDRLVPFGVFLAAGAAVTYGWGDALVALYMTTVLGFGP